MEHRPQTEPSILCPAGRDLLPGRLIERENRFRARVVVNGVEALAHVPNPGRMPELMLPGVPLWLRPASREGRLTAWDLLAVEVDGLWICVDNRLGGRLAGLALKAGAIPELLPYEAVRAEVTHGASRLDYLLTGPVPVWVEVKSCTLVVDGEGLFPDAPTVRGVKHLTELTALATAGERAAVLFVVQRPDASCVRPNVATDPDFGAALAAAQAAGVLLLARLGRWTGDGLQLGAALPVYP